MEKTVKFKKSIAKFTYPWHVYVMHETTKSQKATTERDSNRPFSLFSDPYCRKQDNVYLKEKK